MRYTQNYASPLGNITLASDGEALTGLRFEGQRFFAATLTDGYEEKRLPVFDRTARWLNLYFSGENPDFMPEIHLSDSPFRLEVWEILRQIPYGATTTYGEIAARIAHRHSKKFMAAQAVGGAVGRNPVSIIIPCHRVIGSNGKLTGYSGGLERKKRLLELEKAAYKSR